MMDSRGYSSRVIRANLEANANNPGVALGRFCIERDIPVRDAAEYFGVSRMTIYKWFIGEWIPRKIQRAKIEERLKRVKVSK
jgi:hypothetical protein